jgi:hypothetical protein
MLACVTFNVGKREVWMLQETGVWMLWGSAEKEISEEEGVYRLMPSSTIVALRFAGRAVRKKKTGQ